MARCAATTEQRVDRMRLAEPRQLTFDRRQILAAKLVLSCHNGEVAVSASMTAKRHVHVGGSRTW